MATYKTESKVTLLHKGLGPSLFRYRSKNPLYDEPLGHNAEKLPCIPKGGCEKPTKRIIVKCIDRQDANSMFSKRLQSRQPQPFMYTKKRGIETNPFVREKMFTNPQGKSAGFPPPNFLPRWNPRHKDRTYLDKMILEDPWSLPPEKRRELQRKTGMRLKTISRHYQFKVGANLPYGQEALDNKKCFCYVEFCDHCSKSHTYRCPLHMQLLGDGQLQADCKTEMGEFCPFKKNPEDLPLSKFEDVTLYVSEVVRRLKAGEILPTEVPPFPSKLLVDPRLLRDVDPKQLQVDTGSAADLVKKVVTADSVAQTEPFMMDVDMSSGAKDNVCQSDLPPSDEPLLLSSQKPLDTKLPLISINKNPEKETQVQPFDIIGFDRFAVKFSTKFTCMILAQSLQEIKDETQIHEIQKETACYVQQLCDIQRAQQFRVMQEQFRATAYAQEEFAVARETMAENEVDTNIGAILFAQDFFRGFASKAMEELRNQGALVNQDLKGIQEVLVADLNAQTEEKITLREQSQQLLNDMIIHSLHEVEIDSFLYKMVDLEQLDTGATTLATRGLKEVLRMRDENLDIIKKIKKILVGKGWTLDENGRLVQIQDKISEGEAASESSSEESLDAFLKKIRVSVDSEGNPKYLVDAAGRPLPINVVWLPYIMSTMAKEDPDTKNVVWDTQKMFDVVLSKESFSSKTASDLDLQSNHADVTKRHKKQGHKSQGEVDVGFDDDEDRASDDEHGRIVFKQESHIFNKDDKM